jgi:hypothetical protein
VSCPSQRKTISTRYRKASCTLPDGAIPPGWLTEFFARRATLIHQQDSNELALELSGDSSLHLMIFRDTARYPRLPLSPIRRYDTVMARENKPDRNGYLGFREAVDKFGNTALVQRAINEWREMPMNSELAQYYHLFLTERAINNHYTPSEYKHFLDTASKRLPEIRDPDLRKTIANRIERLTDGFHGAIKTTLLLYKRIDANLPQSVASRQRQHPHETEGQAWFELKRHFDHQQLNHLNQLKSRYERAVDKQVSRALGLEAKTRAATALDLARQYNQEPVKDTPEKAWARFQDREKGADHDKERER